MQHLQLSDGKDLCVELDLVRLNVGRDSSNELVLEDPSVSGFHATVFVENDTVEVVDVGSTNGTWVNGSRVGGRTTLKAWDKIRFGSVELNVADPAGRKPTSVQPAIQVPSPPAVVNSKESLSATLRAVSPGVAPAEFEVRDAVTIGRDPGNILVLNHPTVSSRHAEIRPAGGALEVLDLGSTNGTWVNNQRCQRQLLKQGDRLRFDEIEFVVELPRSAAATMVNPAVKLPPSATAVNPAVESKPAYPTVQEPIVQAEQAPQHPAAQEPRPALPASPIPTPPAPKSEPIAAPKADPAATAVEPAVKAPQPMATPKIPLEASDLSFATEEKTLSDKRGLSWLLFSFQGRIGRLKYLVAALCVGVVSGLVSVLVQAMLLGEVAAFNIYSSRYGEGQLIHFAVSLLVAGWPGIALAAKRFHDQNRSGHWTWLCLVPIINVVVGIMLLFVSGTREDNRFGEPPA